MRQSRDSLASASVERRIGSRKPMCVELRRLNGKARLDIPQTLPVGQLGKRHDPVLLATVQRPHPVVAAIPRNDQAECLPRQKLHQLSKKGLAGVHGSLPWKISKECSEFKSRTPRFAPRLAESVAFRAATRPLTGQQCCTMQN